MAAPEALLKKLSPPMLATLASEPPRDEADWVFELKYDGFRAVVAIADGEVAMWSRNGLDLQARFPGVAKSLRSLRVDEAVMDGEVVALDATGTPRFQLLQRSDAAATVYVAFDLLWLHGHDLRRQPLEQRRELLEKLLARAPKGIVLAQQTTGRAADALAAAAETAGLHLRESPLEGLDQAEGAEQSGARHHRLHAEHAFRQRDRRSAARRSRRR
jgi:bifunctional non-homologous end joining protein LigD